MRTRMPLPTARKAVPMAAVVLPLPGPVLMRMSPRREASRARASDMDCYRGQVMVTALNGRRGRGVRRGW